MTPLTAETAAFQMFFSSKNWIIQPKRISLCYQDKRHIKVDWETHQIFLKYRDKA